MAKSKKTRAGRLLAEHFAFMRAARETNPNEADAGAHECASMCTDVHESACPEAPAADETNPTPLTDRQVAAARLLALGRTGRATAGEVGVNPHTIVRWRRLPGFAAEVRRQHALILAQQVRAATPPRRNAEPAFAARILRKYGFAP